jgi:hypothetical protein
MRAFDVSDLSSLEIFSGVECVDVTPLRAASMAAFPTSSITAHCGQGSDTSEFESCDGADRMRTAAISECRSIGFGGPVSRLAASSRDPEMIALRANERQDC